MKKPVKITLIILGILLAILLVPPVFMPSSYTASSSIVVESTPYNVYPYFADLKNWEKWSPWREKDTSTRYIYSENSYGAGSTMEWDSKNDELGSGKITTVQFKKFHHINYQLDFIKPFESKSGGTISVEKMNDKQSKVTWTNTGKLSWPISRWMGALADIEAMLEKDFNHGLEKMKTLVESNPQRVLPSIKPVEMELPEQLIFSVMHETVLNTEISAKMGESYGAIIAAIAKTGVKPVEAPPVCLIYAHNNKTTKMRPGLVVEGCGVMPNGIECIPIRKGKVLQITYMGDYNKMQSTYDAINMYIEENKISKRENYTWESYVTDPGMETDTAKWLTYIYVPVK